jgi:hypothetical protein
VCLVCLVCLGVDEVCKSEVTVGTYSHLGEGAATKGTHQPAGVSAEEALHERLLCRS